MPTLTLGEKQIAYTVLRGKSRRYTYLRFTPDLTLQIISPRSGGFSIDSLLREKEGWIRRKYDELSRTRRTMQDDSIMFEGRYLRLVFIRSSESERLEVDTEKGEICYWAATRSRIRELVRRWFVRETSMYVVGRLSSIAEEMGVRFRKADVREMRNWGYCTKGGRISINWQLIALPVRLREYVLRHELVHLSEFNHSAAFYRKLRAVCPDYRELERELNGFDTMTPVSAP